MKNLFSPIIAVLVTALAAFAETLHAAIVGHMHNSGLILSLDSPIVPSQGYAYKFAMGKVVNAGQSEIIRQRYYDSILYPLAGAASLSFFALPLGQGVTTAPGAVVGSPKTRFDTNMENANQLPSGKSFLIESIELHFFPGFSAVANNYTAAPIGDFTAVAADATLAAANDVQAFYQAGLFTLGILAKNYLQEFTMAFPPKTGLEGSTAVGSNSATTGTSVLSFWKNCGRPYYVDPMLTLQPAVNFNTSIDYPAAVAMPSGFNGRVQCIFDGVLVRAAQ